MKKLIAISVLIAVIAFTGLYWFGSLVTGLGNKSQEIDQPDTKTTRNQELWKDFTFKGKPIHPLCIIDRARYKETSFDLNECVVDDAEVPKFEGGYLKYSSSFKWGDETLGTRYDYKIVAQKDNTFIIYTNENGGGTDKPSSLLSVKKDGDFITVNEITSGDGCGGSPYGEVLIDSNTLEYKRELTPALIMEVINDSNYNPEYNLSFQKQYCTGTTARYLYTIDSGINKVVLIKLGPLEMSQIEGYTTERDKCLLGILDPYYKKGGFIYKKDFRGIKEKFEAGCLSKTVVQAGVYSLVIRTLDHSAVAYLLKSDSKGFEILY